MNCLHCKKKIVLVPSAQERAKKYGGTPTDYESRFSYHTECQLKLRADSVSELVRRIKQKEVTYEKSRL